MHELYSVKEQIRMIQKRKGCCADASKVADALLEIIRYLEDNKAVGKTH